ncbi:MAG: vitamin K epoxide reductase family protein [Candidatus Magasanikbacteria bacterium]|nr:vitamin K epoxide reductase family protein [Candidatus Magasanikbacteria bacterium]
MMNFKNSLTAWWQKNHSSFPHHFFILFTILSLVGLVDSAYLAALHVRGIAPACTILKGCEQVATSPYSSFFGLVPIAFVGVAYYLAMLFFTVFIWDRERMHLFKFFIGAATIGFIGSLYFLYLQVVVIRALCVYCLISGADTLLFWILATQLARYEHHI